MSSQNVKPLTGKKKKKRNTFCNLKCLYCTIKYISIYHIYHFCLVLTIHVEAINRYTVAFQLSSVKLNACSGEVWFISPRLFSVCSGIGERAGVLISKIYSLTLTTPPQLTWTPPLPPSQPPQTPLRRWAGQLPVSFASGHARLRQCLWPPPCTKSKTGAERPAVAVTPFYDIL